MVPVCAHRIGIVATVVKGCFYREERKRSLNERVHLSVNQSANPERKHYKSHCYRKGKKGPRTHPIV